MNKIAKLSCREREELFLATAHDIKLLEAMTEKDFWVCWTLDYLFHQSPWAKQMAFKGGTSLSKCYGLIERFSEDIDMCFYSILIHVPNSGFSSLKPSVRI
ncbi:MAG: nucleotidyl transferase AbiEii/AbiGii toxin family protein [Eubacteriales bacterium]|nr:nucleotidyl transferase AbiEii/AbiGii toxin family protein [Eubacteriales bacterium]